MPGTLVRAQRFHPVAALVEQHVRPGARQGPLDRALEQRRQGYRGDQVPATAGEAAVAGQQPPGHHRAGRGQQRRLVGQLAERRKGAKGRVTVITRQLSCCGDVDLLDRAGVGRVVGAGCRMPPQRPGPSTAPRRALLLTLLSPDSPFGSGRHARKPRKRWWNRRFPSFTRRVPQALPPEPARGIDLATEIGT